MQEATSLIAVFGGGAAFGGLFGGFAGAKPVCVLTIRPFSGGVGPANLQVLVRGQAVELQIPWLIRGVDGVFEVRGPAFAAVVARTQFREVADIDELPQGQTL